LYIKLKRLRLKLRSNLIRYYFLILKFDLYISYICNIIKDTTMSYCSYVGNFKEEIFYDSITNNYPLKNKKQYDWRPVRYTDLPDEMKYLCFLGSNSLHKTDYILTNPVVIVEHHRRKFSSKEKNKFPFSTHTDREGPADGPCYSILYYYQIDPNIENGDLRFYEFEDDDKPKETFNPISGDLIAFNDNIYHSPGDFSTKSDSLVTRGLLAFFVKL